MKLSELARIMSKLKPLKEEEFQDNPMDHIPDTEDVIQKNLIDKENSDTMIGQDLPFSYEVTNPNNIKVHDEKMDPKVLEHLMKKFGR
jgi:hypothetical protein